MKVKKGKLITEGKTKKVWRVIGMPSHAILENKPDTTAFNDPKFTKIIAGKEIACTSISSRIFELMKEAGLPVAFVKKIGPKEMLVERAEMLKLECIVRRIALPVGSFCKRNPHTAKEPGHRFHRLETELHLKTNGGALVVNGQEIFSGLSAEQDDPIILNPKEANWKMFVNNLPPYHPDADLKLTVDRELILKKHDPEEIDELVRKAFLFLEGLFNIFGYRLADIKFELGICKNRLVIADVIDPDSWRLLTWDWQDFSKQSFRDGLDPSQVGKRYDVIARMVEFFRIPQQALIIWGASEKDSFNVKDILGLRGSLPAGIEVQYVLSSGHKQVFRCLRTLEQILRTYPDGGAIIAAVGRSNGLGPTLSAHTVWPVISVPSDWREKPQNIWSHLDVPSRCPHHVALYKHNALLMALGILAQKNPAAYMMLQYAIEELDTSY